MISSNALTSYWPTFLLELYKMVCDRNESGTFLDIQIPAVLLPKSAGENLELALKSNREGMHYWRRNTILFSSTGVEKLYCHQIYALFIHLFLFVCSESPTLLTWQASCGCSWVCALDNGVGHNHMCVYMVSMGLPWWCSWTLQARKGMAM